MGQHLMLNLAMLIIRVFPACPSLCQANRRLINNGRRLPTISNTSSTISKDILINKGARISNSHIQQQRLRLRLRTTDLRTQASRLPSGHNITLRTVKIMDSISSRQVPQCNNIPVLHPYQHLQLLVITGTNLKGVLGAILPQYIKSRPLPMC